MKTELIEIDTSNTHFADITQRVLAFCSGAGGDGVLNVFVPHATAGLALIETGSGSEGDLEDALERLLPRDHRYAHSHGSRGHGADHVLPALVSPSLSIPVVDGRPGLGTWQSVVLVDLNNDNPHRNVRLSFVPA
jgi:secondary thiamine-phosphate synthase enzyme